MCVGRVSWAQGVCEQGVCVCASRVYARRVQAPHACRRPGRRRVYAGPAYTRSAGPAYGVASIQHQRTHVLHAAACWCCMLKHQRVCWPVYAGPAYTCCMLALQHTATRAACWRCSIQHVHTLLAMCACWCCSIQHVHTHVLHAGRVCMLVCVCRTSIHTRCSWPCVYAGLCMQSMLYAGLCMQDHVCMLVHVCMLACVCRTSIHACCSWRGQHTWATGPVRTSRVQAPHV
jgi:hypothetical protein